MRDWGFWKGRRVFLTGNTGFKGTWLSLWLEDLGAEVSGFSLAPPTRPSLFELVGKKQGGALVEGDIRDRDALHRAVHAAEPEIVFHLAAQPLVRDSYADPIGTLSTNIMGTAHLLDAVRTCQSVRALVNVTTDKCYENKEWPWGYRETEPMGGFDPYSSSKGCSELVTAAFRRSYFGASSHGEGHPVAVATARAGNVIGGGDFAKDRLIPDILRALEEGRKVVLRHPTAIRPWQHVLEPLSGYLTLARALVEHGERFAEAWNFGPEDGDAKTVEWITRTLTGLVPGAAGFEIDPSPQPHEAHYLKLDISKAKSFLGWAPRWNLEAALGRIVEWSRGKPANARETTLRQIREFAHLG